MEINIGLNVSFIFDWKGILENAGEVKIRKFMQKK
jgi:hypothetical protein